MENGFEIVCQQVVLLLPLFRDHLPCRPTKCIEISICTGADELSQQFAVRHSPYAAFMSNLAASSSGARLLQATSDGTAQRSAIRRRIAGSGLCYLSRTGRICRFAPWRSVCRDAAKGTGTGLGSRAFSLEGRGLHRGRCLASDNAKASSCGPRCLIDVVLEEKLAVGQDVGPAVGMRTARSTAACSSRSSTIRGSVSRMSWKRL